MSGFVYMWINNINSKKYVGSHIGSKDDGYIGSGPVFLKAVEKYGIDNFTRVILEEIEEDNWVRDREEFYLNLFNVAHDKSFYNLKNSAMGGWDYINNSPEIRAKSKESGKDRWQRYPHPKGMKNKTHSDETKSRISKSSKLAAKTRNYNKSRPVIKLSLDNEVICEYESISEAARDVKGSPSNIKYCIEGDFKTAYKHKWKYKE